MHPQAQTGSITVQVGFNGYLCCRNPVVTVTSFDRPNLYLEVRVKGGSASADLLPLLQSDDEYSGATIIYCPTKKDTEDVAIAIRSKN